jgi:hypothetical protein
LTIDDADPVATGQFELEAGATYEHAADCKHWDFPLGLAYGLMPNLELGVGLGGQFEERTEFLEDRAGEHSVHAHGLGDLVLGAKWRFSESCPLGARHALVPMVKLPTADSGKGLGNGATDYDLMWIASRSLGAKAGLHLNLGYSWIGGPDGDVLHYGVALDYEIVATVQWVGEVFTEKELGGAAASVVQYNTGLRWEPIESLTLDLAGGAKISGDAPDFTVTAGLTWTFGFKNK